MFARPRPRPEDINTAIGDNGPSVGWVGGVLLTSLLVYHFIV